MEAAIQPAANIVESKPKPCYMCGCSASDPCYVHGLACVMLADGACSACEAISETVGQTVGRDWLIRLLVETMSDGKPIKPPDFVPSRAWQAVIDSLDRDPWRRDSVRDPAHDAMRVARTHQSNSRPPLPAESLAIRNAGDSQEGGD